MTLRLRTLCWLRTGDETRFSFPACNVPGPPRPRPSARKPTLSTSRDRQPRAMPVSRSLRAVDSGWIQLRVLLSGPQGDRRSCSHQALRLGLGSHARSLVFAVRWASSQGLSCSRRLGTRQVQAASGWPPESRGLEVQAQKSHLKPPSTSLSERRPPSPEPSAWSHAPLRVGRDDGRTAKWPSFGDGNGLWPLLPPSGSSSCICGERL